MTEWEHSQVALQMFDVAAAKDEFYRFKREQDALFSAADSFMMAQVS